MDDFKNFIQIEIRKIRPMHISSFEKSVKNTNRKEVSRPDRQTVRQMYDGRTDTRRASAKT